MAVGPEEIGIHTEFIKLDAFLKFSALSASGGEAKAMIQEGLVRVNGETCTQRGKKLRDGDVITVNGESLAVREEKA